MTWSRNSRLLLTAAAVVIVVAGLKAAAEIIGPLVLALSLTIVFHPLRLRLERRFPSWAVSIVVLVAVYTLILLLVLSLVVAVGRLAVLVPTYATQMDDYVQNVGDWLQDAGVGPEQVAAVTGSADVGRLVGAVTDLLSGLLGVLSNLFFIIALLLFLAFDSARVRELAAGAREDHGAFVDAMTSFAKGTRSYLAVTAVFGLIVAVVDTGLLWALGIPAAFVWGVLAFVTNFIPNIGFVIGVVPPALIGLLEGGVDLMLVVIVTYSVVNVIIQSVIQPRFVGNAVGLSTTLTFVSLVFWAWVLGPLGALLAVPMSLFFKAVLVEMDPATRWMGPLVSGRPEGELP